MAPTKFPTVSTASTRPRVPTLLSAWSTVVEPLETAPESVQLAWRDAQEALQSQDFVAAKASIGRALQMATKSGEPELIRRLQAGQLALDFELGTKIAPDQAREVLAGAETLATTTVSAYLLGCLFEERKEWRKARFYAQSALTAATSAGRPRWQAIAHNLLGNVLVAQSYFGDAVPHYHRVLETKEVSDLERAQAADNLGFALAAQGELDAARPFFAQALNTLRSVEGPARLSVELDLALFHSLCGQPARSIHFANAALRRADALGDRTSRANALLLLAEGAKASGNVFLTRRCLAELTDLYDAEFAAALGTFDVLQLVNLKA